MINFHKVNDHLYRSGQPHTDEWQGLYDLGIRCVISLNESIDISATKIGMEVKHVHLPDEQTQSVLKDADVLRYLDACVDSAPEPLLVHCTEGRDRTGIVIARYRVRKDGWTKQQAWDEWHDRGSHHYVGLEKAWSEWVP